MRVMYSVICKVILSNCLFGAADPRQHMRTVRLVLDPSCSWSSYWFRSTVPRWPMGWAGLLVCKAKSICSKSLSVRRAAEQAASNQGSTSSVGGDSELVALDGGILGAVELDREGLGGVVGVTKVGGVMPSKGGKGTVDILASGGIQGREGEASFSAHFGILGWGTGASEGEV
jgi:hypothetical protein